MWAQQLIFTEKHALFNHVTSTRVAEILWFSTAQALQYNEFTVFLMAEFNLEAKIDVWKKNS